MSTGYTKTATTKQHYLQSQKQTYICPCITKIVSLDLYLIHAESHPRSYTYTFILPKYRVLKRHCNDCIKTLAYFLTQVIYLSHILSLHEPLSNIYKHIFSHIYTVPSHSNVTGKREKSKQRKDSTQVYRRFLHCLTASLSAVSRSLRLTMCNSRLDIDFRIEC